MTTNADSEQEKLEMAGAARPDRVRVWEDEFHVVHVSIDGETFPRVRPVRVFPISEKGDYVSFLGEDDKEVCLLAHPKRLDKESRKALEHALARMYYVPKITRVDRITEIMGVANWEVMTDRGYAAFEIVDRRHHIRALRDGRYVLTDADGNRFEIEDVSALDPRSQALVHSEV
jgi:hypothetical protein